MTRSPLWSRQGQRISLLVAGLLAGSSLTVGGTTAEAWSPDATAVSCGAVLTESVTLTTDLWCSSGDALVVGADNITIDLGGHTVGTASFNGAAGVRVPGHDGVTVRNGIISGGDYGVVLERGANRNTLAALTMGGLQLAGIAIQDSNGNLVRNSYTYESAGNGILLVDANRNTLKRNRMAKFDDDANAHGGIALFSNSNNNRVIDNRTSSNGRDGLYVSAGSIGNLIARNKATSNTDDGIDIDDPNNTVRDNVADNNFAGFGIEAVPGTSDGGGNTAAGNGEPAQCLNIRCD